MILNYVRIGELKDFGGPQLIQELFALFMSRTQGQIDNLCSSIELSDHIKRVQLSHAMKSGCLTIGAEALGSLLQMLEKEEKENVETRKKEWIDKLQVTYKTTVEIMRQIP